MRKAKYLISGLTGRSRPKACPSCGSSDSSAVDNKYFHVLHECAECHLLYRYPLETPEQSKAFYESGYAEPGLTTELPADAELKHLIDTRFRGTEKDWTPRIEILRSLKAGRRLLDYGANWGYSTWQLRLAGYEADAYEPSRTRAAFGRKLGVDIRSDLGELSPPYDVVLSSHVLEHTPDPKAALLQQMSLLEDGGLVIAHTPNGSQAFRTDRPREFHHLWGQSHAVLLTDLFVAGVASSCPYLISSNDQSSHIQYWNQSSQVIDDCSSSGLFFAIRRSLPALQAMSARLDGEAIS